MSDLQPSKKLEADTGGIEEKVYQVKDIFSFTNRRTERQVRDFIKDKITIPDSINCRILPSVEYKIFDDHCRIDFGPPKVGCETGWFLYPITHSEIGIILYKKHYDVLICKRPLLPEYDRIWNELEIGLQEAYENVQNE